MKIAVDYDPATGQVNHNGVYIGTLPMNLSIPEVKQGNDVVVQLVTSGMSAEDIVKLKHGGVL